MDAFNTRRYADLFKFIQNEYKRKYNYNLIDDKLNVFLTLMATAHEIMKQTGFAWKLSAYVYDSFSHRDANAIDLVPDIMEKYEDLYAHNYKSDPVLYRRKPLMIKLHKVTKTKQLQDLVRDLLSYKATVVIAVEQNHLHLGVYKHDRTNTDDFTYPNNIRLWKWQDTEGHKYVDTKSRQLIAAKDLYDIS